MACLYRTTRPSPGDSNNVLLRKWIQSVGAELGCPDEREWVLVAELVRHYGGIPRAGDTLPELWQALLRALGGVECHCGDWQFDSIRRILELLGGIARPGDSISELLRKILESVNEIPVNPCCPPPSGDYGMVTAPVTVMCDFDLVTQAVDCAADWGSV